MFNEKKLTTEHSKNLKYTCYCDGIIIPRFFDYIKYFWTYGLNPVWQSSEQELTNESKLVF